MSVFIDKDELLSPLLQLFSTSTKSLDICLDSKNILLLGHSLIKKELIQAKIRGTIVKIITEIDKDNLSFCKDLVKTMDNETFHSLSGVKNNFFTNENQYAVISGPYDYKKESTLGRINVNIVDKSEIVCQQHSLFAFLWERSLSARKIIELLDTQTLQEKEEKEFLRVITDHDEATETFVSLAKSITKEALLLLSNSKAMMREYKMGVLQELVDASNNGAEVKIISPLDAENADIVIWLSEQAPNIKILDKDPTSITVFIVDSQRFLKAELKEEDAELFPMAVGFVVYSNSKPTVSAFKSFFNMFWKQSNLNEKLRKVNEELRKVNDELKRTDKAKDDFVNIAAHELKNPIQMITLSVELLQIELHEKGLLRYDDGNGDSNSSIKDNILTIIRTTHRLQRLAEVLLDVGRIELGTFRLNIESEVNIDNLIADLVKDIDKKFAITNVKVNYLSYLNKEEDAIVTCDTTRVSQVLLNLLDYAIKFTKEGEITVSVEKKASSPYEGQLIIKVKDTGTGIDEQIKPRLFEKFATNSTKGTGLGLYLSKNIVEAHGGRMWTENNIDSKGATFSLALPIHGQI
ncbi:MAG: HAMP domain-containing histidine kinase [Thermoproteota archaeon]|nr:HAMP domain-containing histidine kinase [Thermoproteota archaeon]